MIKYGGFVAYLVLCVKGWQTGLVSLAKLNIDIKGGITLLIESCSINRGEKPAIGQVLRGSLPLLTNDKPMIGIQNVRK